MAAGIRTLPACLGENLTRKVLILILLVSSSSLEDRPALIYRKLREFVISGEPVIGRAIRVSVVG